jgi:DNA-binding transcriptional regulator YiaG
MCKHVAAVLYGVGSRLDNRPELLFLLRDVDAEELISAGISMPAVAAGEDGGIADDQLSGIFGIDLDVGEASPTKSAPKTAPASRQMKESTPRKKQEPAAEKGHKTGAGNRRPEKTPAVKPSQADGPSMEASARFRPTGQSVARLRKQLGLSVEQFAKRVGVTAASIYRWEVSAGELKLQARPLANLARIEQQAGKRGKS